MKAQSMDKLATALFTLAAATVIALLFGLIGYIFFLGVRYINLDFLTKPAEAILAGGGIGHQIFNSFYLLFLSMLISLPLALWSAVYLAEYARPSFFTDAIRLSIETLSSLPSIVVGLFGLLLFVNYFQLGYSVLAGALALTVLNLPLLVRFTEESLRAVPRDLREGSLALGANRWQTTWKVVFPSALPGIITGTIIAAGRAFGEAAALLYTAGMSGPELNFHIWSWTNPRSPLSLLRPAETLAVHIWKVNSEQLLKDAPRVANGSAAVLAIMVLLFNIIARWLGKRLQTRFQGEK